MGGEFLAESEKHGWPSFRDAEVVWENVRVLKSSGEVVSATGSHLGHNIPDARGNRYCINLVSVAGRPATDALEADADPNAESVESSLGRFPGFAAWLVFVWVAVPAMLAALNIHVPERL